MKQITVYSFNDLSADIQETVINRMSDINLDEWWEYVYEDAEGVSLEITGFDIDRRIISLQFIDSAVDTAYKILSNHGEMVDTYKLAKSFISDRDSLVEKYSDGVNLNVVDDDNEDAFDTECDELEADFLKALGEEYLSLLRQEYKYLASREAIIESIEANDYHFTADGRII